MALLSLPDIGVNDLVVVEGSRSTQLQDGPGHVLGSVLAGPAGDQRDRGRSLSFGAPFERISELAAGAEITVTTGQGVFVVRRPRLAHEGRPGPAALPEGAAG